jgi:hypothetical protein
VYGKIVPKDFSAGLEQLLTEGISFLLFWTRKMMDTSASTLKQ